jgi:cystine transport system ATP-binding protein
LPKRSPLTSCSDDRDHGRGEAVRPNTVLNHATFQIQEAQLTSILGPSGCGKSTMLRCMNRLERFDRGTLRIGGVEVKGSEDEPLSAAEEKELTRRVRERVGIVFQNFNSVPASHGA